MRFTILTLFPEACEAYFNTSILKRAQIKKLISINIIDIRRFTNDKHNTADDKPYGGGPGMVLKAEPILKAVDSLRFRVRGQKKKIKIIISSAAGKKFTNTMAKNYALQTANLILIAGHYEGIDERVKKILKAEEVSIGPYVLTGGELPVMVMVDAIVRHIPGALGHAKSLEGARFGIGVPSYTRPEVIVYKGKKYRVPSVLLSGDHKRIEEWRKGMRKTKKTK